MSTIEQAERTIWLDRFTTPTLEALTRSYPDPYASLAGSLVEALVSRTRRKATVEWRGVPWRWTGVFRRSGETEPWAYFVPSHEAPVLAMPVPADLLTQHTDSQAIPRGLRDAIERAPLVGQIRWAEWPVTSEAVLDELIGLIDRICEPYPD